MGLSLLKNLFICRDCLYALNWIIAHIRVRIILQCLLGNNFLSTVRVSAPYTDIYDIYNYTWQLSLWESKLLCSFELILLAALQFAKRELLIQALYVLSLCICLYVLLRLSSGILEAYTLNLPCTYAWNIVVIPDIWIYYMCRYVGLLVLHLKLLWTLGSLPKYGQTLYSRRRTAYFKKIHDFFVTIPRYYKDVIMWYYNIKTSELYTWQSYKRKSYY